MNGSISACWWKAKSCSWPDSCSAQRYLRRIAGTLFGASILKLLAADVTAGESITLASHTWMSWSPMAILSAAVFYINRSLLVAQGALYSTAAAGLAALRPRC